MSTQNKHAVYSKDAVDPSKDPRNEGHNGNPAQSAGRVTAQEQNAHPDALGTDPNLPDPNAPDGNEAPHDPSRPPPKPGEPGGEDAPTPASENI